MRIIGAASLVALCGILACAPARADTVPPFRGNDTGGIIAYSLTGQISFACRWLPYAERARRASY
jgi:hypothetical protein